MRSSRGRLAELGAAGPQLETALVLSASTQAGAIEETVARFANANPASCLLTKVDEAASLGGVLSVLTRAKLPISYVCEGQRVPEDLRPARALELVSSAVQLAQIERRDRGRRSVASTLWRGGTCHRMKVRP